MNTPLTRNEIIGYAIALIVGLASAAATYFAPSHAEETKYRLEHQRPAPTEQTLPKANDKAADSARFLSGMKSKPKTPKAPSKQALYLAGVVQRKQEKYARLEAQQAARIAHANLVRAEIAAGTRPPGSSYCLPGDTYCLRAEGRRRREDARAAAEIAKQEKAAEKEKRRKYQRQVRSLTERQELRQLPGIHLRRNGYELDHVVPVAVAYSLGWPAEQTAGIGNLQLIPKEENATKGTTCYSSLDARRLPMAA